MAPQARAGGSDRGHFRRLLDALRYQRLLPAARQQVAVGRSFHTTAMNCMQEVLLKIHPKELSKNSSRVSLLLGLVGAVAALFIILGLTATPLEDWDLMHILLVVLASWAAGTLCSLLYCLRAILLAQ